MLASGHGVLFDGVCMKPSHLAAALLFVVAMLQVSCSGTEERDGRQYHGTASPLQGKMGVTFKRVRSTLPPVTTNVDAAPAMANAEASPSPAVSTSASAAAAESSEGLLGKFIPKVDGPPGLLDLRGKPDEPGAEYWMHGQQSPNPIQGKMGVRVSRRKK